MALVVDDRMAHVAVAQRGSIVALHLVHNGEVTQARSPRRQNMNDDQKTWLHGALPDRG